MLPLAYLAVIIINSILITGTFRFLFEPISYAYFTGELSVVPVIFISALLFLIKVNFQLPYLSNEDEYEDVSEMYAAENKLISHHIVITGVVSVVYYVLLLLCVHQGII